MNTPLLKIHLPRCRKFQKNCEVIQNYELSTYENVPSIQNNNLPYIDEDLHNYTNLITPPSNTSTKQSYVNIPPITDSSSIDYSYFYSNTLLTAHLNFKCPLS